ncbi:phosphoglycerate kinase [Vibrio fortis]|uniref:phosphoglycerate kinase n=1 Tax=Vibrio fortis TaxID=212667 RepID=UPI0029828251|nr:phosphoglycerate kinase [Vibrio fortis]
MKECAIPVATDVACAKAFDENAEAEIKHVSEVADDDMIFDLGPESTAALAEIIGNAKTILGTACRRIRIQELRSGYSRYL